MSQNAIKRTHLIYGICLSVVIILAALSIILSCYAIYDGGDGEFSREIVAERFSKIAVLVYLCLAGVVGGIILSICLPIQKESASKENIKSLKAHPNFFMTLERLAQKVSLDTCEPKLARKIKTERAKRVIYACVCTAICAITAIPLLLHIGNPLNYDKYLINQSIIPAVVFTLIWCLCALIFCLILSIITRISQRAEIAYLKEAISLGAAAPQKSDNCAKTKKETVILWSVRGVILAAAIVFIVVGIFNGGMADVLGKAIRLCTECIGLG